MKRRLSTLLLAAGMATLLLIAGATTLRAAQTSIDCTLAGAATCNISDSDGIQAVRVIEYQAPGNVTVVDQTYSCESDIPVQWDYVVPQFSVEVDDCDGQTALAFHFNDLIHHPLGDAQLRSTDQELHVASMDGDGDDGVSIDTGEASYWAAWMLPAEPPPGGGLEAAAFGLASTPETSIQFSHHMTDVIVYPSPAFDGDPYQVRLFAGETPVYEEDDIPSGDSPVGLAQWFCAGGGALLDCAPQLAVGLHPSTGLWFWELRFVQPQGVETPAGRLTADRLRFLQQGTPDPAPPPLTRIELRGRDLPQLTLFDGFTRPPLPTNSLALPIFVNGSGSDPDPYGLEALTDFLEAPTPPSPSLRISEHLFVETIGPGNLVDAPVEEEMPGGEPRGEPQPDEPPASGIPGETQALRVFNTANQMEYEIQIGGELLQSIHRLRQLHSATGAAPGMGGMGADLLGSLRVTLQSQPPLVLQDPGGWSNGTDSRSLLTATTLWPWRTIVHFSNNCSGVLIGPRHILTAAHCINQRGTNNWFTFTVSPGRNGSDKPYGDSQMNPNPQPGDPFRWYFTPAQWRSSQYNNANCGTSCYEATQWDWGLIIIPEKLGYQTGWMGYVARPAGSLNSQAHFNRGYPWCGTPNGNAPASCQSASLYGDTTLCPMGNYLYPGNDNWNRVIRTGCDISGGHSGSPIYHYFYDVHLGQTVPVAAMVVAWEHCYTCSSGNDTPNSARRLTPGDLGIISFFRQWKP